MRRHCNGTSVGGQSYVPWRHAPAKNVCSHHLQAGEEGSAAQRSAQLPADAQQTVDREGGLASMLVQFFLAAMRHGGDAGTLLSEPPRLQCHIQDWLRIGLDLLYDILAQI